MQFDMNFPGIGFGCLPIEDVFPVIQTLPSNVNVWTYDKVKGLCYDEM